MNDHLAPLFDGSLTGGIYRVNPSDTTRTAGGQSPIEATDLVDALRAAGWQVALLPPVSGRTAFYDAIARALNLPPYFGANLDALWDCLADLQRPTVLVLSGWSHLAAARPRWWDDLVSLLQERADQSSPFAVLLA